MRQGSSGKPPRPRGRAHGTGPAQREKPARPPASITPSRRVAFEILSLVSAGKGHSDDLLHSSRMAGLSSEDRNLATALVMGVLRWQIALDARIAPLLARPGQKLPEPVALALRMGAFQLLHMDRIPAHAALSESVELCRAAGQPQAAGMVNAILRRLSIAPGAGNPIFETVPRLAERLGHPDWLVARWVAAYGRDAAVAICLYDQQEPAAGQMFSPAEGDSASQLPAIDDGSRLIAELAAAAAPGRHAARVWDCCAAPGGKTLVLAARLPGCELLATDISPRRLEHMKSRLAGVGFAERVKTAVADAADRTGASCAKQSFDLILCDVPCSGTGTLARNPEIRLQLKPEDLPRQAARQKAILNNAARHLAPGGRLVYSTCSLEPEENEAIIASAAQGVTLRQLSIAPILEMLTHRGELAAQAAQLLLNSGVRNGNLRTLPGTHPCDGFFAALFERV